MKTLVWSLIFLFCSVSYCEGATIETARGPREVNDGDILKPNSMWTGTVEGLDDVTFIQWNFSRKQPHTEVFINCTNLKFIDCNLNNVELQEDFLVDGCLTIHQKEYEIEGVTYREVECGDNKIRTWRKDYIVEDDVEDNFSTSKKKDKDKIKALMEENGKETVRTLERQVLISETDTPVDKLIKALRANLR